MLSLRLNINLKEVDFSENSYGRALPKLTRDAGLL